MLHYRHYGYSSPLLTIVGPRLTGEPFCVAMHSILWQVPAILSDERHDVPAAAAAAAAADADAEKYEGIYSPLRRNLVLVMTKGGTLGLAVYRSRKILIDDEHEQAQIVRGTAGQEQFHKITSSYYPLQRRQETRRENAASHSDGFGSSYMYISHTVAAVMSLCYSTMQWTNVGL